MKLTVDKVMEIEDDFQEIFLSKGGIHVRPRFKELKMSQRSIGDIKHIDLYIIEPNKYYCISFKESLSAYTEDDGVYHYLRTEDIFSECGLLTAWLPKKEKLYIYNVSNNIIYIQKGMKVGEVVE